MPPRPSPRPVDERAPLSARQMSFITHYLLSFNATQAALKAGYSAKGATTQGSILLSNAKVKAEISKRKSALAARSELSRDWLLHELAEEFQAAREPTVRKNDKGEVISVTRKPQAVARIGELLARMNGWIEDKPGNTNQTLVNFVVQR